MSKRGRKRRARSKSAATHGKRPNAESLNGGCGIVKTSRTRSVFIQA